jgi:F0F1-type ATP synthase assembly protein I
MPQTQQQGNQAAIAMANLVGQIGCLTSFASLVIIGISFGLGYLLDQYLGMNRPIFAMLAMLASFPVTLYAIVRISVWAMGRAQQAQQRALEREKSLQEDQS